MTNVSSRRPHRIANLLLTVAMTLAWAGMPGTLAAQAGDGPQPQDHAATTLYLVRHAEKVDDSRDPELSAAGHTRAALLAEMLADAGIQRIYSTDYIRTRDTAGPLADDLGVEVESYDPTDLTAFAATLLERGGRAMVSGHSNTTPSLVSALGGDPGVPIDDAEYDRLYIVTVGPDGTVSTVLLRFGEPFGG